MEFWESLHWAIKLGLYAVALGVALVALFFIGLCAVAYGAGKIEDPEDYNGDHP
jgi:Na+-transporting methylmalonyl-CoA/oxaloacetate decarboxylase gamma subunit